MDPFLFSDLRRVHALLFLSHTRTCLSRPPCLSISCLFSFTRALLRLDSLCLCPCLSHTFIYACASPSRSRFLSSQPVPIAPGRGLFSQCACGCDLTRAHAYRCRERRTNTHTHTHTHTFTHTHTHARIHRWLAIPSRSHRVGAVLLLLPSYDTVLVFVFAPRLCEEAHVCCGSWLPFVSLVGHALR